MKVLNLYAGIGGNRKLWTDVEVTALELDPNIAAIYQDYFPDDKVIVGDAHQYLLDHYKEFDFIWSSPPCPTHSRMNFLLNEQENKSISYPDMNLYQEIILLDNWFDGLYVVENVKSYYNPLIPPTESGSHYFWSNFRIGNYNLRTKKRNDRGFTLEVKQKLQGIEVSNWYNYKGDKRKVLNNCVDINQGLYILNCARNIITKSNIEQTTIWNY